MSAGAAAARGFQANSTPTSPGGGLAASGKTSVRRGCCKRLARLPLEASRRFRRFQTPFFVPAIQPIELFFFQRVFEHLCNAQEERRKSSKIANQSEDPALSTSGSAQNKSSSS